MSLWDAALQQPRFRGYFVQFYGSDQAALVQQASQFLWEGLLGGEGTLVIARPGLEKAFRGRLTELGANVEGLESKKQLRFLDAEATLKRFLVDGMPNWVSFAKTVRAALRSSRPTPGVKGYRIFGDMSGVLLEAGNFEAAMQLKENWVRLQGQSSFSLYSACPIDLFGTPDLYQLDALLRSHSHVVTSETDAGLRSSLLRAIDEMLGAKARTVRSAIRSEARPGYAELPEAERIVLWLYKNLPDKADALIHEARKFERERIRAARAEAGQEERK